MVFAVLLATAFFNAVSSDYVDYCNFTNFYHQLDTSIADANYEVADDGGNIRVAVGDLQADLQFSFFGWTFPYFSVPVVASGGVLSLWGGLRRSGGYGYGVGYSDNCSEIDDFMATLTSVSSTYVTYERMIAKFLFWEIENKFSYRFQPAIQIFEMQNSSYCGATEIHVIHPMDIPFISSAMEFRNYGVLEIVSLPFFFFSTLSDHVIKLIQAPLATLINDHVAKAWCKKYHE